MTGRELPPGLYRFDDVSTGDWIRTGTIEITAKFIDAFAALTGDDFEIHMDDHAAQAKGFQGRVAHGLLILSLVDASKNHTPAQFDAIASLGWEWTFAAPVLIGDRLTATVTVFRKQEVSDQARGILHLVFEVQSTANAVVQHGRNKLMVRR